MRYTVERVAASDLKVGDVVLRGGIAPKSDCFVEMTVSRIKDSPPSHGKYNDLVIQFDDVSQRVAYYSNRKELLRVVAGKKRGGRFRR